MKEIKVATFCGPGEKCVSYVNAYTYYYHTDWNNCVIFNVQAKNGIEAKKIAKRLRIEHEARRVNPEPPEGV